MTPTSSARAARGDRANRGIRRFFRNIIDADQPAYLSAVTIGELQRGIGLVRHRGDHAQAERLEDWLTRVRGEYGDAILPIDSDIALIWGICAHRTPGTRSTSS